CCATKSCRRSADLQEESMQCKWAHVFTRTALNIALGVAVAAAMLALPAGAQSFHRLESATMLKSANPDWDYITLDATRGLLFIGRRGDGVAVVDVRARKRGRTLGRT